MQIDALEWEGGGGERGIFTRWGGHEEAEKCTFKLWSGQEEEEIMQI